MHVSGRCVFVLFCLKVKLKYVFRIYYLVTPDRRYAMSGKKVALAVAGLVVGTLVTLVLLDGAVTGELGGLFTRVTLPNVGSVKAIGVGVYWDSACSNKTASIDWGTVEPRSAAGVTVYIRNEGNAPVTLSLETENWSPPNASSYISLTWDYGGQVIDVDGVVEVRLSLSVSDSIEGITSFSFDIVIIGSG